MERDFTVDGLQMIIQDRHVIIYCVRLPNFRNTLPLTYEKWFSFHCSVSSTSFMFRVTFQRAPNEGGVDCVVLIRRTDDIGIRVDGELRMNVVPGFHNFRVPPRCIRLDGMPRFAQTTSIVEAFIPNDILTLLWGRYVFFDVNFSICGCHRENDVQVEAPPGGA